MAQGKPSSVWPINENGEVVAVAGTGTTNIVGFLNQDTIPADAEGKFAIVGVGGGGGSGVSSITVNAPLNKTGTASVPILSLPAATTAQAGHMTTSQVAALSSALQAVPIATTAQIGGIKPDGVTLTVDAQGIASAVGGGGNSESYTVGAFSTVLTPTSASTANPVSPASATCNCLIVRNSRENVTIEFNISGGTMFWPIQPGEVFPIFGITNADQVGFRRADYLTSRDTQRTTIAYQPATTTSSYPVARSRTATPGNTGYTTLFAQATVGAELYNPSSIDLLVRIAGVSVELARFKTMRVDVANTNLISVSTATGSNQGALYVQAFTSKYPGAEAPKREYGIAEIVSPTARVPLGDMASNSSIEFSHPADSTPFKRYKYNRKSLSMWNLASSVNITSGLSKADVALSSLAAGSVYPTNGPRAQFTGGTVPQITWAGATTESFTSTINATQGVDLTGGGAIHVALQKVSGTATTLNIDLFSAGDSSTPSNPGANYHTFDNAGDLGGGFIGLNSVFSRNFGVGRLTAVGTGADLSSIKFVRVRIAGSAGMIIIPSSVDYVKPTSNKNVVIFSIDDNHGGAAFNALSVLSPYGFPAVLYMSPTVVSVGGNAGTDGNVTIDNMLALQNKFGWQIASQDYFGTDQDRTPEQWISEQRKELILGQQLGFDLDGMRDGSLYGATNYPMNSEQLKVANRLWGSIRRFDNGTGSPGDGIPAFFFADTNPPGDPMNMRALNMDSWNSGTLAQQYTKLKSYYDRAKLQNSGIAHFATHTGWNDANIRGAMQQLITNDILPDVIAGTTEVLTMQQLRNR